MSIAIFAFIKIDNNLSHLEFFQEGRLFMRTLRYFKNYEDKCLHGRGDKLEGSIGVFQPSQVKLELNGIPLNSFQFQDQIIVHSESLLEKHTFCLITSYINDESPMISDEKSKHFKLDSKNYKFGGWLLIIRDPQEFLNRVKQSFKQQHIIYRIGMVKYYNFVETNTMFDDIETGFQKPFEFSHQNEFRILIDSPIIDEQCIIVKIPSIKDISLIIKTDELNDHLHLNMNQ